jgi:hypothetical protein
LSIISCAPRVRVIENNFGPHNKSYILEDNFREIKAYYTWEIKEDKFGRQVYDTSTYHLFYSELNQVFYLEQETIFAYNSSIDSIVAICKLNNDTMYDVLSPYRHLKKCKVWLEGQEFVKLKTGEIKKCYHIKDIYNGFRDGKEYVTSYSMFVDVVSLDLVRLKSYDLLVVDSYYTGRNELPCPIRYVHKDSVKIRLKCASGS